MKNHIIISLLFLISCGSSDDNAHQEQAREKKEMIKELSGFKLRWNRFKKVKNFNEELKLFAKKVNISLGNSSLNTQGEIDAVKLTEKIKGTDTTLVIEVPKEKLVALQKDTTGGLSLSPVFYLKENPKFYFNIKQNNVFGKRAEMNGKSQEIKLMREISYSDFKQGTSADFFIDGQYFELENSQTQQEIVKDSIQIKILK